MIQSHSPSQGSKYHPSRLLALAPEVTEFAASQNYPTTVNGDKGVLELSSSFLRYRGKSSDSVAVEDLTLVPGDIIITIPYDAVRQIRVGSWGKLIIDSAESTLEKTTVASGRLISKETVANWEVTKSAVVLRPETEKRTKTSTYFSTIGPRSPLSRSEFAAALAAFLYEMGAINASGTRSLWRSTVLAAFLVLLSAIFFKTAITAGFSEDPGGPGFGFVFLLIGIPISLNGASISKSIAVISKRLCLPKLLGAGMSTFFLGSILALSESVLLLVLVVKYFQIVSRLSM